MLIVKIQHNSTQLKSTIKQLALELNEDIMFTPILKSRVLQIKIFT